MSETLLSLDTQLFGKRAEVGHLEIGLVRGILVRQLSAVDERTTETAHAGTHDIE